MRVLQAGIDKSGNYWLYRIIRLLMDAADIPRKSWILKDPIYQVAKDWQLSFPGANELDVISWDGTPAGAYRSGSYETQALRERAYYYSIIPMYRRRIVDLDQYLSSNSHLWTHSVWHDDLPEQILNRIDKTVYIIRDPRDVLVSGAHFVDSDYCQREFGVPRIPFPERFSRLLTTVPEWAVHVAGWVGHAHDAGIHVVSYEGLATDLPFQLRRLAAYFGFELTDAQFREIRDEVAFNSMKATTPTGHVRKGVIGNWKNELPEAVASRANAMLGPLPGVFGYQDSGGSLSAFLTHGEISDEARVLLAQINEQQARRRIQAPATGQPPAAGPQKPGPMTGWR